MMRALRWIVRIVLFLLLFAFAAKNTDYVTLHFFLETDWQAPLVLVLLAVFAAGALLGAALGASASLGRRQQVVPVELEVPAPVASAPHFTEGGAGHA